MKAPKDNFSGQSANYNRYRPAYPQELYDFIFSHCSQFGSALDCATGNGQVAKFLSKKFTKVLATDISQNQLAEAYQATNIEYSAQRAEKTDFPDHTFDLITVGQAYHWFDFEAFGKEANRLLKPDGLIAIWTYGLLRLDDTLTPLLDSFYKNVTGPYWDDERKWVDQGYREMPFYFKEIDTDFSFQIHTRFTIDDFKGYLNTWSGVKHFISKEGYNPVDQFIEEIGSHWHNVSLKVHYPGFVRIGKPL
ncbi:MAG: class I SAM-dependent methyltransferase [Roseivirga sp.]